MNTKEFEQSLKVQPTFYELYYVLHREGRTKAEAAAVINRYFELTISAKHLHLFWMVENNGIIDLERHHFLREGSRLLFPVYVVFYEDAKMHFADNVTELSKFNYSRNDKARLSGLNCACCGMDFSKKGCGAMFEKCDLETRENTRFRALNELDKREFKNVGMGTDGNEI